MNKRSFFIVTKKNIKHNFSVEVYRQFFGLTVEIDSTKNNVFPVFEVT